MRLHAAPQQQCSRMHAEHNGLKASSGAGHAYTCSQHIHSKQPWSWVLEPRQLSSKLEILGLGRTWPLGKTPWGRLCPAFS